MSPKRLLVDTNVLVAAILERDALHERAITLLGSVPAALMTCWPVLTETAYLVRTHKDGIQPLVTLCKQSPFVAIADIHPNELAVIANWMRKYHAMKPDFADACLMHLAERHNLDSILSFDDDFDTYRTTTGRARRRLFGRESP